MINQIEGVLNKRVYRTVTIGMLVLVVAGYLIYKRYGV